MLLLISYYTIILDYVKVYKGVLVVINMEKKCTMCGSEAGYIATETNEPLCQECMEINEQIKRGNYSEKLEKFKPILIEDDINK